MSWEQVKGRYRFARGVGVSKIEAALFALDKGPGYNGALNEAAEWIGS